MKCYQCNKELPKGTKPCGKWAFKGSSHRLYLCSVECSQAYYKIKQEVAKVEHDNNPFNKINWR